MPAERRRRDDVKEDERVEVKDEKVGGFDDGRVLLSSGGRGKASGSVSESVHVRVNGCVCCVCVW